MSDLFIFIAGFVVFAATTTATLLYGYFSFHAAAVDDGVGQADPLSPDDIERARAKEA